MVCTIAILGIVITALTQYGPDLTITTRQLICAAIFPGIGMALGYGEAYQPRMLITGRLPNW